jgi:serine/threonine protein kinase
MTVPAECSAFIGFTEAGRPTLVVKIGADLTEIPLENKRAFLRAAWSPTPGAPETDAFVLQAWPTGRTAWVFFCPSKEVAQCCLDALAEVGCIMTNLTKKCSVMSKSEIGSGSTSRVIRATMNDEADGESQRDVVMKIATPGSEELLVNEVQKVGFLMRNSTLFEKYVVNTKGLYELLMAGKPALATVLDLLPGGDLSARVPAAGMPEADARRVFHQLLSAAVAMGDLGMVHRDIKPENILCDTDEDGSLRVRLIDFALATFLDNAEQIERRCGTPGFIAPEILRRNPQATSKSDCFSLGATLFFAVTGVRPFGTASHVGTILERNVLGFTAENSGLSAELEDLLRGLGKADPAERLSAADALAHPWFEEHAL